MGEAMYKQGISKCLKTETDSDFARVEQTNEHLLWDELLVGDVKAAAGKDGIFVQSAVLSVEQEAALEYIRRMELD